MSDPDGREVAERANATIKKMGEVGQHVHQQALLRARLPLQPHSLEVHHFYLNFLSQLTQYKKTTKNIHIFLYSSWRPMAASLRRIRYWMFDCCLKRFIL